MSKQKPDFWERLVSGCKYSKLNLKQAEWNIHVALVAGIISTALTALFMIIGGLEEYTSWFDVILMAALTFGIYRKSFVSTLLFFIYFLGSKIIQVADGITLNIIGAALALLFLYSFLLGTLGAHRYRKLKKITMGQKEIYFWGIFTGVALTIVLSIIWFYLSEVRP